MASIMALPLVLSIFSPFFFFYQAHQVTFNYPSGPVLSCLPGLGVLFFFLKILVTSPPEYLLNIPSWYCLLSLSLSPCSQEWSLKQRREWRQRATNGVETENSPGGWACTHHPLLSCLRGTPSIHCPNQKGLNCPVPSVSVLRVLLGVLSYSCLSHLIYNTAIFRNVSVHIFHPFDEIHIFFTLFSSMDFMYQGNPCLVVEWKYKWHLHPYALPLVLLTDPFKGYNSVILHILLCEGPRNI